jgi:nucleoside-diphosphate-sugar epimerase
MTKKIAVVTGGIGYLGSKIISRLLDANYIVRLILRTGSHHELTECVEIIYTNDLDCESVECWTAVTKGADILIHCAWYVEHGLYMESSKNISSLHGLIKIAFGALDSCVRKFIGIGTCLEYGDPFSSSDKNISPNSLYASSKLSAFLLLT